MERCSFLGGEGHTPIWAFNLNASFSFGFVRHPLARFVSAFFHSPNITGYPRTKQGFIAFVESLKEQTPTYSYPGLKGWDIHHHFLPQWFFLCDKNRRIAVNFAGRYESLTADWNHVCKIIGVQEALPHHRKGKHLDPYSYYTLATEQKVREFYREDLEIFGYE